MTAWSALTDRRVIAFQEADRRLHGRVLARLHPGRRSADRPSDAEWAAIQAGRISRSVR